MSPERLLASCERLSPIAFWHGPSTEAGQGIAMVGFGETVRLEGRGPERLIAIEKQATDLYGKLQIDRVEAASFAPGPRLLGGLSFRIEPSRSEPWTAFADASFTLPRWLYIADESAACLWFSVRAEDLVVARGAIETELEIIADVMETADPSPMERPIAPRDPADDAWSEDTNGEAFRALVEEALADIRRGVLEKVVAVASNRLSKRTPIDPRGVIARLSAAYADTTRFAVERDGHVFLGASPERLVSRRGFVVETDGLAGTAKRGADDVSIMQTLLESAKDRHEHALVVRAIADVLGPRASSLDVPAEPRIRGLRNVFHLWTPIRAVLRDETHVLSLVDALHPTPAVSGTPRERATSWIATHEPFARGWYTGAVGWIDAAGDGDFVVAIRAGLLGPTDVWLYAGAGIVEGSDPLAELAETRAKQAPMLAALGLSS